MLSHHLRTYSRVIRLGLAIVAALAVMDSRAADTAKILTPPAPQTPRVNGPTVFGVRPNSPFQYQIPATGQRPMEFNVTGLPDGLSVDSRTGLIRGALVEPGEYVVTLHAKNALGTAEKSLRIRCGDTICLTPPMGWNSWNCWGASVSAEKVLRSAKAMIDSGLAQHGWTYINIDDGWQGKRTGPDHALQANEKFPDFKALCDQVHAMGLKLGVYSTPWTTSYGNYAGGSSDDPEGKWDREKDGGEKGKRFGTHAFAMADAKQWGAWGVDYLKYDWHTIDVPHVEEISKALRASGRDIVLSLSNSAPFEHAADWARLANCWRTTGDIWDYWDYSDQSWRFGVSEIAFSQDRWAPHSGPGHWNDPDMMVLGQVGWGPTLHATHLTPDQQYSHMSMWCLLSAPLLIGCDLEQLDEFTRSLLTNDEVLALQYDALGKQATRVATVGAVDVYLKPLEDGSTALGFFNRGKAEVKTTFNKLDRFGLGGAVKVRDLWRQKDLEDAKGSLTLEIPGDGVVLLKLHRLGS
ncbi:MAG TPA: putative Ig domain-containing protein [Opitutaceae bacterium]|nr:putative Ig domain-containing protein [Opitutaceae bacterium]